MSTNIVHPKPKILLVDLPDECEEILAKHGFNATSGSLGKVQRCGRSEEHVMIPFNGNLPNVDEQEIIVFDFAASESIDPFRELERVPGDSGYTSSKQLGIIDSRATAVAIFNEDFERILEHGGIFVIFADIEPSVGTFMGRIDDFRRFEVFEGEQSFLWSVSRTTSPTHFDIVSRRGNEIFVHTGSMLSSILERHLEGATFSCILQPEISKDWHTQEVTGISNRSAESYEVLAHNKFDETVSAAFRPDESHKGSILILPQIKDKSGFLLELIRDYLPSISPELFPYNSKIDWTLDNAYQPASVLDKIQEIERLRTDFQEKIATLQTEIESERISYGYLHRLLTATGADLVDAVKQSLTVLGFTDVVDLDEKLSELEASSQNDEDLQIFGDEETLLVEIKGIFGQPKDDAVFQVTKHVPIRMKEWKRTNVRALSIINHQRGLPGLKRDLEPFRDLQLASAIRQDLGLMTTFDLFRLVRNFLNLGWSHENVKGLFFNSGRIHPIPDHYKLVGHIETYWGRPKVVGIRIASGGIPIKGRLAFEFPIDFHEITIESLQVENESVNLATAGNLAGVQTDIAPERLRKGTRI